MEFVGKRIKNIRKSLGLSVESVSQKLEISRSYLTLIENGERRLPKKLVGKLSEALGLSENIVYDWYLEQELIEMGIKDKKSYGLIRRVLKMTPKEKESLLKVLKERK